MGCKDKELPRHCILYLTAFVCFVVVFVFLPTALESNTVSFKYYLLALAEMQVYMNTFPKLTVLIMET